MEIVYVGVAIVGAAAIGWCGPRFIALAREPLSDAEETDEEPKPLYSDLAARPGLAPRLAALAAVLMAIASLGIDEPLLLPAWATFAGVGSWLAYVDLRTRYLPWDLTAPLHLVALALVGLASLVAMDRAIILMALIGNVVVYTVFWLIWQLGRWFEQPFGMGDVRVAGIFGLLLGALGYDETVYGTIVGFSLGALAGLALLVRGRVGLKDPYAFGPYLIIGAFFGPPLALVF